MTPDPGAGHIPVLLAEMLAALAPAAGEIYIDGTFGAGGYSRAILAAAGCRVIAFERDPHATAAGRAMAEAHPDRLRIIEACFGDMEDEVAALGCGSVDGVVLDIGVSSMQIDTAARGFSFQADGPLDMRMEADGHSAAALVMGASEALLADILFHLGEERQARRIARAIARARDAQPISTTHQLAALVEKAIGRRKGDDRHPATRTFQALRIHVNDELGELARGLVAAERVLKPGGRLVVVAFHSLEDRIVKRFLARRASPSKAGSRHAPPVAREAATPSFRIVNPRPLTPSVAEIDRNPRARSAKLRAAVRTAAPAFEPEAAPTLGIPDFAAD